MIEEKQLQDLYEKVYTLHEMLETRTRIERSIMNYDKVLAVGISSAKVHIVPKSSIPNLDSKNFSIDEDTALRLATRARNERVERLKGIDKYIEENFI